MSTTNNRKYKDMPKVAKINRAINFSHASMTNSDDSPIEIEYHEALGVQNILKKKSGEDNVANPVKGDEARLNESGDILGVGFTFTVLPNNNTLYFSNDGAYEKVRNVIENIIADEDINKEIFGLYAGNIYNGSWLWRNLLSSVNLNIVVHAEDLINGNGEQNPVSEEDLPDLMWESFTGKNVYRFYVSSTMQMAAGKGSQVYPSQEFTKPKKLLKINGNQAAIRDTKIWNAIRTIDTWYTDYNIYKRAIAVEPVGANKDLNIKLRIDAGFFNAIVTSTDDVSELTTNERLFVAAVLHRGGVFAE